MLNSNKRISLLREYYLFDFDFRFLIRQYENKSGLLTALYNSNFSNLDFGDYYNWYAFRASLFSKKLDYSLGKFEKQFHQLGLELSLNGLIPELNKIKFNKLDSDEFEKMRDLILGKNESFNQYSFWSGVRGTKYEDKKYDSKYILNLAGYEIFLQNKKQNRE